MSDHNTTMSVADELEKLSRLRESGAISAKEFAEAKRQVLAPPGVDRSAADTPSTSLQGGDSPFAPLPSSFTPKGATGAASTAASGDASPALIVPSGSFELGNLLGRDDPPPIPVETRPAPPVEPGPAVDPDAAMTSGRIKPLKVAVDPRKGSEQDRAPDAPPAADEPPPRFVSYAAPGIKPGVAWRYVPWFLVVGVISALALWTTLLPGHRPFAGALLLGVGAILTLVSAIWLLLAAARVSVMWFVLVVLAALFFPLANLVFILVHWRDARGPFLTNLVGVGLLLGGLILLLGSLGTDLAAYLDFGEGRQSIRFSTPAPASGGWIRRSVRWRPGSKFTCRAFQNRLDDCESSWMSHLEGEVRVKGMGVATERIAVMMPRVAVEQAQSLVFERAGQQRCLLAHKRKHPLEQTWLSKTRACMKRRGCRGFSACHVKVFLQYVGRIPFHCKAYCNREVFHCGRALMKRRLVREHGQQVQVTPAAFASVRPQLHRRCLRHCARIAKKEPVRERLHECTFQPNCSKFFECMKGVPTSH